MLSTLPQMGAHRLYAFRASTGLSLIRDAAMRLPQRLTSIYTSRLSSFESHDLIFRAIVFAAARLCRMPRLRLTDTRDAMLARVSTDFGALQDASTFHVRMTMSFRFDII
jgi:hypothetical protein